jgi:pentatricopeptide repeat protein
MPKLPGHITPTLEHYHMFLKALPDMETCTLRIMRSIVKNMRPVGCKPTHETFEILWINRWKLYDAGNNIIRPNTATALFDDMERDGLSHSPSFSALLFQEYSRRGFPAYAEQARNMYDARFSANDTSASPAYGEMDIRLIRAAHSKGMRSAIILFKSWKPDRIPSPKQIGTLLRHSRLLADLRLIEQEFSVKCDVAHWTRIIMNNTRAGQLREALSIYDESKLAGIIPDTTMASPLIHSLCQSSFSPPQEADIEKALSIYQDLCSAVSPEENYADHPSSPDQDIYSTLLRGLATVKNFYKYMNTAKKIMDDMAARDVTYEDSATATSIIALHIRNATNTEEALEIYRRLKSPLDDKGYTTVLNIFCKLRFEATTTIPSLRGYFEIVKDMRLAGFNTTVEVYTILLHQLGIIATEVRQRHGFPDAPLVLERLIHTLRRVHDLLTLDASLSPDAVLWNQMINTYQRLGCFADAYRIWEMMYISGQFNSSSVSSILDACGYASAYSIARRVVERLMKDNYRFTSHNWSTWLECLCRVGKLDEAIKILCGESETSPQGVRLDAESVKLVFKFAKGEGRGGEMLRQVMEKSPDLWDTLPVHVQEFI